jgi:hypothetical protein
MKNKTKRREKISILQVTTEPDTFLSFRIDIQETYKKVEKSFVFCEKKVLCSKAAFVS